VADETLKPMPMTSISLLRLRRIPLAATLSGLLFAPLLHGQTIQVTNCTSDALLAGISNALSQGIVTGTRRATVEVTCTNVILFDGFIWISNTVFSGYHEVVVSNATGQPLMISGNTALTNRSSPLFLIGPGVRFGLHGFTLANSDNTNGGAILNYGWLELTDCVVSNNRALGPHGAEGRAGSDSASHIGGNGGPGGNGARGAGGAIFNAGTTCINRCTFSTNGAFGGDGGGGGPGGDGAIQGGDGGGGGQGGNALGGAIYSLGSLAVTNSAFFDNYTVGGLGGPGGTNGAGPIPSYIGRGGAGGTAWGGGICSLGSATLVGSAFARNRAFGAESAGAGTGLHPVDGREGASSFGGGFCNRGTSVVVNCTFNGNETIGGQGGNGSTTDFLGGDGGHGGNAWGGNIYNNAQLFLTNCTVAAGGAIPGLGGAGGGGFASTNSPVAFPGDDGAEGANRGSNLANDGGTFFLRNCLIANPPNGTNTVITTNVVEVTTNVPTTVVVVSTNLYGTTNCVQLPTNCLTAVVLTNTVLTFAVTTNLYISSDTNYPACEPVDDPDCFSTVVLTNLVLRNGAWILSVTTNSFLDPDCSEEGCYSLLVTTNVVAISNVVTTNLLVLPSNTTCFVADCPTNIVLTNLVVLNVPTFVGYATNYVTNTTVTAGFNAEGLFADGGYNLSSDATPSFSGTSRNNLDPLLGFFGDHGGPTPTLNLLERSPAIDQGDPGFCLPTDQRGTNRVFGARCDIGAFEYAFFRIRGRITDGVNPLGDVTVTATNRSDSSVRSTITSSDGTYLLNVPPGTYTVSAQRTRFTFNPAAQTVSVEILGQSGRNVDFTGFQSYTISGQILYQGVGLAGIRVNLGSLTDVTDSQGSYILGPLPPGTHTITPVSSAYSFQPAAITTNVVAANLQQVNFVASGIFRVAGRITNALGAPLTNITVTAGNRTRVTDSNGAYSLGRFPPGFLTILPSSPRHVFAPAARLLYLVEDELEVGFLGQPLFNLGGRITNASGAPMIGVLVTVSSNAAVLGTTLTDQTGNYLFANLPEGRYTVAASKSGFAFNPPTQERNLDRDRLSVNFAGSRLFTIGGRITEGADPVRGVVVRIGSTNVVTDAQGFFLQTLPAGSYPVVPTLIGYQFTPTQQVATVGPDAPTLNFAAQTVGFSVRGRITFAGTGLAGVTVHVGDRSLQTEADGSFAILGLAEGEHEVEPVLAGYEFEPPSEVVTLGPSVTGVDFEALGALSISGFVRKNGVGLDGVTVSAGNYGTETVFGGFYFLEALPPGRYLVTPSLKDHVFNPTNRDVTLTNEDAGPLNFTATELFSLSGRITLSEAGLAGVVVHVGDRTTQTAADGTYGFTGLLAGDYEVEPKMPGMKFEPDVELVTLGPSLTNVDFEAMGGLNISGYVRKLGVGLPGVQMEATNIVTLTDDTGFYSFDYLLPGSYTVAPSLANHSFTPASWPVVLTTNDAESVNFAAAELFTIRGRITQDGAGLPGVQVSAAGQTVISDTNGFYLVSNLVAAANLAVVPALSGYFFEPMQALVTLGPSTNGVDFAAGLASATNAVVLSITSTHQQVRLLFQGAALQTYQLQATDRLASPTNWQTLSTNLTADSQGRFEYHEALSTNAPGRFYRTVK
jgi:hypothetical protein